MSPRINYIVQCCSFFLKVELIRNHMNRVINEVKPPIQNKNDPAGKQIHPFLLFCCRIDTHIKQQTTKIKQQRNLRVLQTNLRKTIL